MHRILKKTQKGFTLIELMIVVAIIGILAAVAIPQFLDMMKSSKRSEAEVNLDAIKKGAKSWIPEHEAFPIGTAALTPAASCCNSGRNDRKCNPDPTLWNGVEPWDDLSFTVDEPHYFQYAYASADGSEMTANAVGDLDCDGTPVTYTLNGLWNNGNPSYDIVKPARAD